MYLIVEHYIEDNIDYVVIENTERAVQKTYKLNNLRIAYEDLNSVEFGNNCFNFDDTGYTQGDLKRLPRKGQFHVGNKIFLICKVDSNYTQTLYIVYTKNGLVPMLGETIIKYCKLGLVVNAHTEVRNGKEIIKMYKGRMKVSPMIPYVDTSKFIEYERIIRRNTRVIDNLLLNDNIIKNYTLPKEYLRLHKRLSKYDLRFLFNVIVKTTSVPDGYKNRALNTLMYRLPSVINAYLNYEANNSKETFEHLRFEYTMLMINLDSALHY